MAQRVHEAVESLVRDGLTLEAAAYEHHDVLPAAQRIEEAADQGGLAHSRAAVDEERHGAALFRDRFEGALEQGQLPAPPHEGCCSRIGDGCLRADRSEERRVGKECRSRW